MVDDHTIVCAGLTKLLKLHVRGTPYVPPQIGGAIENLFVRRRKRQCSSPASNARSCNCLPRGPLHERDHLFLETAQHTVVVSRVPNYGQAELQDDLRLGYIHH